MNKRSTTLVVTGIAALGIAWANLGVAQQTAPKSAADVLKSISKNSDEIQQLLSNLHSPDPSVRVATFNAMVESNNTSLVTLAINDAHTSSDATIRDLAVRAAMRQISTLALEPSSDPDSGSELFNRFTSMGSLRLNIAKYDPQHGMFEAGVSAGEISGTTFSFRNNICQGTLTAVAGTWSYEGPVSCHWNADTMRQRLKLTIR